MARRMGDEDRERQIAADWFTEKSERTRCDATTSRWPYPTCPTLTILNASCKTEDDPDFGRDGEQNS